MSTHADHVPWNAAHACTAGRIVQFFLQVFNYYTTSSSSHAIAVSTAFLLWTRGIASPTDLFLSYMKRKSLASSYFYLGKRRGPSARQRQFSWVRISLFSVRKFCLYIAVCADWLPCKFAASAYELLCVACPARQSEDKRA